MALSYNLGYQESISVHPTRRQICAGKPYSTFCNIWDLLISVLFWATVWLPHRHIQLLLLRWQSCDIWAGESSFSFSFHVNVKAINCSQMSSYTTLPKAQQPRGLSSAYQSNLFRSYHKFKHQSWSHFIFRILTKHQLKTSTKRQSLH